MPENTTLKKTLGIFSLTCCEGCQFELLNFYGDFSHILNFFEIKNFSLAKEENLPGPFDVVLVEGTPETEEELKLLKEVRKQSEVLISMGTCAHLGGIQAGRNFKESEVKHHKAVLPISKVVKVDYVLPGCPINRQEAYKILLDIYHGREPYTTNYPVCFECRQNQVKCLMKEGRLCLGPISCGGCDAICTTSGFPCLGCRGPVEQTNLYKIKELAHNTFSDKEINQRLEIYGEFVETMGKKNHAK